MLDAGVSSNKEENNTLKQILISFELESSFYLRHWIDRESKVNHNYCVKK